MAIERGTKIPVFLQGIGEQIAQAEITEVNREDGYAVILVPGTRVQVGIKVELDDTPEVPTPSGVETQFIGTENKGGEITNADVQQLNPPQEVPVITQAPAAGVAGPTEPAQAASVGEPTTPPPATLVENSNPATPDAPKE